MKTAIKSTIIVCGLLGNVTINSNQNIEYLEDDSLFTKTSIHLMRGWESGVNYAQADDDIEVICCGTVFPGPGGGGFGGGGESNDASENAGSDGDGPSYSYSEIAAYSECVSDAEAGRQTCITDREEFINVAADVCQVTASTAGMVGSMYVSPLGGAIIYVASASACVAAKYEDLDNVSSYCATEVDNAKEECEDLLT